MGGVADGHDDVARRRAAIARVALTAQPDRLSFVDSGWHGDVQHLPGRQGDANRAAMRDRRQRNRNRDAHVLAVRRLTAPARAAGAEQLRQNVGIDRTAFSRKPAAAEVEAEIAKVAAAASSRLAAKTESLELRRSRLPFGVDLAAIEGFALLVIAEDFVGRADFGEALLGPRLLALVGMVLLGELAKGGLDFGRARGLRHAKNVVRITHYEPIPRPRLDSSAGTHVSVAHLALRPAPRKSAAFVGHRALA